MTGLPTGTVTFLVTDIEGSTARWEQAPDAMAPALARHDALLRETIVSHGGHVVKTMGDAFHAAFQDAANAVTAAIDAQRLLVAEPWPEARSLRVRMALHTGITEERSGDYYGPPMNRVARLLSTGHGGQILLSEATALLVRERLPADASLLDLGEHRLKDLTQPERVFQVTAPGLLAEFPPLISLDALPNNLPRQLTSFVGRGQEMADVKRLLAATSLLTLVGTGGAGKTRLSLQVAADILDAYRDGAWLVELAPLSDPDLVPRLVATTLGVREQAGRPLMQTLQGHLRTRTLLLVLDNCEHLVAACATLAEGLLRACPNLRILATSREALGIAGETTWRVPSLSMPDPGQAGFGAADLAATLPQYEAVRLFIDRALAVYPGFAVTNQNAPAVAQICHRLDGIPLALELAAARIRVLAPEQIAARLDDRLRLLTGGSRTALPRQQTLRALVDWSYDLLSEQERTLLQRLSVFAGGWTLEAAESVCAGEDIEDFEILDLLTQLVDKSIVIAETRGGETRYRLLETLRQYARERLVAAGHPEQVQRRHAGYYADLAGKANAEIMGAGQTVWLDRLDRDHDNLSTAVRWAIEHGDAALGLRLAASLSYYWYYRGYQSEGRTLRAAVLALPAGPELATLRVAAIQGEGLQAILQGDYASARAIQEEGVAMGRAGERALLPPMLATLGFVMRVQEDFEVGRAALEEAIVVAREVGDTFYLGMALHHLGLLTLEADHDLQAAWSLNEEALAILSGLGNLRMEGVVRLALGRVARARGDLAEARALASRSLTAHRDLGEGGNQPLMLNVLAGIDADQGHIERAIRLAAAAAALNEAMGTRTWPFVIRERDAWLARARAALGEERYATLWREGQALTLAAAVALALDPALGKRKPHAPGSG